MDIAVRIVGEDGWPYRPASWPLWRDHRVCVPFVTMQHWVEAGGKKAAARMGPALLDWALADCSGSVAVDAWYDGPFCGRSAVDNRHDKRLRSEVLDRHPSHDDIRAFLGRRKSALEVRALTLRGVTTDGSPRYPDPTKESGYQRTSTR